MDIITHSMMGAIAAAPLLERHPFIACGVLIGSVLPDLDILSYAFGRRAMMRFHQTWTHSAAGVLVAGGCYGVLLASLGMPEAFMHELWLGPLALMAGMAVHIGTVR